MEHHFGCHDFCGDWCHRKDESPEERSASKKQYRSKETHADLYSLLQETLEGFVTEEALVEVAHGYDTNVNESLNNTISWPAPKNKVYAGSNLLRNHVMMAVSVQIMGYDEFYRRFFKGIGLDMDGRTWHLEGNNKERSRLNKLGSSIFVADKFVASFPNLDKQDHLSQSKTVTAPGAVCTTCCSKKN